MSTELVPLIREALFSDADPQKLQKLLEVRREWQADEARAQFNQAIAEFQKCAPIVAKADRAYDKQYARMDRIWREIRPLLTELGLSVTWQICELRSDGICHLEGQLRHKDGHGERLVRDIPMPELLKGQNKAQQAGSASTYAQRYALCGALGVVTGDDDDGHAAATQFVTKEQATTIADMLDACRGLPDFNEAAFWKFAGVERGRTDLIAANRLNDVLGSLERKLKGPAK
jgi:hypothetical protein